jgi:amino acid transporter
MLTASKIEDECRSCKKRKLVFEEKKPVGLLATILLVLLPKCPFCLMAYSSTFILCGKGESATAETMHVSYNTVFIISFFCFAVLLSVILNYRDARTKYALVLAAAGCFFIIYSVCVGGGLPLYYSGVFLVAIGVWLNGSLLYVISKIAGKRKII